MDKAQAWQDLHKLTQDKNKFVRWKAAYVLETVFGQVPDKVPAWHDLIRLAQDEDALVRWEAAGALGRAFGQVPDKGQAWQDLQTLIQDEDSFVRRGAADALGRAFSHVLNKAQAWQDLQTLIQDEDNFVRMYAYHSLGRASVLKATEADGKVILRKELENAVVYFEKSTQEVSFFHAAKFCHPFYRTYLAITFQEAKEDEVQRYLAEAKEAVGGSESKYELLKAVENLARALQESQRLKDRSFQEVANELNAYRWYCDKASEYMIAAEDKAPGAVKLLRKCNPILDERIHAIIAEIQEKAWQICQITRGKGTDYEYIGAEINKAAKVLSTEDIHNIHKNVSIITSQLTELCRILPDNTKKLACEAVDGIQMAAEFPEKLDKMKEALAYIVPVTELSLQVKDVMKEIQTAKDDILGRLSQSEKNTVEALLKALGEEYQDLQFQDQMKETLDALVELLVQIKKKKALDSDPTMTEKVKSTTKIIEDYNVNLKRKMEVTIPLIPVLLNYKWEVELEGGDINLRAAWNKLRSSLRM